MANIQKPDMTNIWASEGARVEPTEAKQLEGWVVEPPPHQWENWSQWRQDSALAHIFQKGVPLWDNKTSFHEGGSSYVQGSDGKIYISLQRSGGSVAARNPVTAGNSSFWKVAFTASDEMIAQSRITNLTSDLGNKASTSYVNTELGKKLTKSSNLSDLTNVTTARTNLGLGSSSVYPINNSVTLDSSVSVASSKAVKTLNDNKANKTTRVIAGTGLTGGGDLSTNRTLNVSYGVIANTSAQGNDSRIVGAVQDTQIKQAVGSSVTDLMSQKATSDAINVAAGTSTWAGVSGKPSQATRWPSWNEVTSKPDVILKDSDAQLSGLNINSSNFANLNLTNSVGTFKSILIEFSNENLTFAFRENYGESSGQKRASISSNVGTIYGSGNLPVVQTTGASTTNIMSQKAVSNQLLGVGQTWQDVKSSRSPNTTYTNTTGRPIFISLVLRDSASGAAILYIDGLAVGLTNIDGSTSVGVEAQVSVIVPAGSTYRTLINTQQSIINWMELR